MSKMLTSPQYYSESGIVNDMLSGDIKNESGIALGQGAVAGEREVQIGASDKLYRLSAGSGSVAPVAIMWYKGTTPRTRISFFTFGIFFSTGTEGFNKLYDYIKQNGNEVGPIQPPSEYQIGNSVSFTSNNPGYPVSGVDLSGNGYQIAGLATGYVNDQTSAKRIYIIGEKIDSGGNESYYIADYIDANGTSRVGFEVISSGETEDTTATETQSIPEDTLNDQSE